MSSAGVNSIVVIVAAIVVIITYLIARERYGLFDDSKRKYPRYNAFYHRTFWRSFANTFPEQPFSIVERFPDSPPLTDRVIVFSLYGTNTTRYFDPLYKSLTCCRHLLSGWHFRIYVHDQCHHWIEKLKKCSDVQLFVVHDPHVIPGNSAGAFWRFLPLCEPINAIILDSDDNVDLAKLFKIWNDLNDKDAVLSVTQCNPWPDAHIQAKLIFKKKSARPFFGAEDIRMYQHRSSFGSDEVFTTLELAPALQSQGIIRRRSFINKLFARKIVGTGLFTNP